MNSGIGQTGKKIVQKAQQLLQERGYQYFSFQDLADAMGIRKASVHYYFRSKEDLAESMIIDYRTRLEKWAQALEAKELKPQDKLRAYFEVFLDLSRSGKSVCPGGSLLLDWNNFSKPIQSQLQGLLAQHHKWLQTLLEEAIQQKCSRISKEDVKAHVILIGSSLQGGLQIARANRDPEGLLKIIFKHIEQLTFKVTFKEKSS